MRMYLTNIFKSLIALLFLSSPTMLCAKHFKVLDISDGLANNVALRMLYRTSLSVI